MEESEFRTNRRTVNQIGSVLVEQLCEKDLKMGNKVGTLC